MTLDVSLWLEVRINYFDDHGENPIEVVVADEAQRVLRSAGAILRQHDFGHLKIYRRELSTDAEAEVFDVTLKPRNDSVRARTDWSTVGMTGSAVAGGSLEEGAFRLALALPAPADAPQTVEVSFQPVEGEVQVTLHGTIDRLRVAEIRLGGADGPRADYRDVGSPASTETGVRTKREFHLHGLFRYAAGDWPDYWVTGPNLTPVRLPVPDFAHATADAMGRRLAHSIVVF